MDSSELGFRRLFDQCYRPLMAYALRRCTNQTAAEDVVAETFLVAWRRWPDVEAMANPLPWLYGVAANVVRNQQRASRRHLRLVDRLGHEPSLEPSVGSGASVLLQPGGANLPVVEALRTLSFDDQEVLRLITWEELSHAEAATALGCSVDAVAQRVHRARERLARAMALPRKASSQ